MGNGSSPPGWVAQLANLGGTRDQSLKFDNLLRSRAPQESRPTTALDTRHSTAFAEFVAVDSKASARTRAGHSEPTSLVAVMNPPTSPPRNGRGLLLTHQWVRSLYTMCPVATPPLSPPAFWAR